MAMGMSMNKNCPKAQLIAQIEEAATDQKYFENPLPKEAEFAIHYVNDKIPQSTLPASFAAIYNYEPLAYANQAFVFLLC